MDLTESQLSIRTALCLGSLVMEWFSCHRGAPAGRCWGLLWDTLPPAFLGSVGYLLPALLDTLLSCIAGWLDTYENGLFSWWSLLAVWSSRWPSSTVSEGVVFVWKTGVIEWLKFFVWQRSWPSYHFFLPVWTSCSHNSHNQSSSLLFVWETMSEWMGSSPRHFRPETECFTSFILETCRNLWQSQVVHPGILHFDDKMILSCSFQHIWSCLPLPSHLYLLLPF